MNVQCTRCSFKLISMCATSVLFDEFSMFRNPYHALIHTCICQHITNKHLSYLICWKRKNREEVLRSHLNSFCSRQIIINSNLTHVLSSSTIHGKFFYILGIIILRFLLKTTMLCSSIQHLAVQIMNWYSHLDLFVCRTLKVVVEVGLLES